MTIKSREELITERLESVQTRIGHLRAILEDENAMTDLTADQVNETINRDSLRQELSNLERQETVLLGFRPRCNRIDLTRF